MPFDAQIIEAQLALDMIHPEDMPALAWDALEAGLDGPAITRLAALVRPSGWEVDQMRSRFMADAGLQSISNATACMRVAQQLAGRILSERLDPLLYSKEFESLWIRADYPVAIQEVGSLEDQKYVAEYTGQSETELREYALRTLRDLVVSAEAIV